MKGSTRVMVLDTIGRTRLIPLQRMVPEGSARVLVRLEYENPTGSMKDRMALAMIETARKLAAAPGSYWTDQMATARLLARQESIFAGTSTGANVALALRVAGRLGPDHTVVTVAVSIPA